MSTTPKPLDLSPDCDLNYTMFVEDVDPATAELAPVTDGEIDVFLAAGLDSDEPADPTFVGTATHIGVDTPTGDQKPNGTWLFRIDGAVLTRSALQAVFKGTGAPTPYLVIRRAGDFRRVVKYKYVDAILAQFATE